MADNYKILGQSVTDGIATDYTVYTVPSATSSALSSMIIANNSGSSATYKTGIVKSADSGTAGISNTQTIIPTKTIAAGEIDEIVGGITLSAGDQIRIYSESPDLTVHIYGTEIS